MNVTDISITWNNRLCFLILPLILIVCACSTLKTSVKTDVGNVRSLVRIVIEEQEETRVLARLSEIGLQPVKLGQVQIINGCDPNVICLLLEINWNDRAQFLADRSRLIHDDGFKIFDFQIAEIK